MARGSLVFTGYGFVPTRRLLQRLTRAYTRLKIALVKGVRENKCFEFDSEGSGKRGNRHIAS